jgi:competence protein ComEC
MREPLLLPMVAIAGGIVLGQALEFGIRDSAIPFTLFGALAMLPVAKWLRRITLALCLLFAGAFLIAAHRPTRVPMIDAPPREMVLAQGCVVAPTVFSNDRAQFVLELEPGARVQVQVPKYAEEVNPPRLTYGQRVEIEARFREPHNFNNPGAFDYTAYLGRQDIFWTALVPSKGTVRVLPGECGSRWRGWIFGLRTAAIDSIERLYPDNRYASAMLEAVLIGESTNLERVWTEDFRRSGTYHALVISGIHVSVLAGVLLALLHFAPISKNSAWAITAAAAWLYALVSGFTIPVARAAAGFTLYLIARIVFRRVRPLNLLSAIAIGLLAWDPSQLFEASFQLSFLSVAAIAAFAAPLLEQTITPLARGLHDINATSIDPHIEPRAAQLRVELRLVAETILLCTRVPTRFVSQTLAFGMRGVFFAVEMAALSLSVQIGLALPMAEYFHRISFTGLSANLLIVPLMNLVVPIGFVALFTGWHWAASLADTLLRWSAGIAGWHAALEPAWRVPNPPWCLALALVASILIAAVSVRRNLLRWPALAVVAALVALLVVSPWAAASESGELELTVIDVGQGDSLLLVFPEGKTMLIDGGGRLEYGKLKRRSNLDIGEDVVSSYLWSRGFRHIDVLAVTHAHQDHVGGLSALMENFHPTELWTGANPPPALVEQAVRQGVRVSERRAAEAFHFSGASVQVLAPALDYVPSGPGNNDSLVLRVALGSRSFLLTGDLERAEELRLLESGNLRQTDVLKVGHHGSRTSTTQDFLDAVSPSVAVISAGFENTFGHPHPDVMGRLETRHTTILRTDLDGLATVRTDGKRLNYLVQAWQPPAKLLELPVHLLH